MEQLTLYGIMGEDMSIHAKLIDKKHVCVEVIDESDNTVYKETSHLYAWDSLVIFANKVLKLDKKIQEHLIRIEDASQ